MRQPIAFPILRLLRQQAERWEYEANEKDASAAAFRTTGRPELTHQLIGEARAYRKAARDAREAADQLAKDWPHLQPQPTGDADAE